MEFDRDRILAVIGRLSFRFAKTMPQIPHEYAVRSAENEADYVTLAQAILDHGIFARFNKRRHRYLHPGDGRKYWLMTTDIRHSRILNRARIGDYDAENRPLRSRTAEDMANPPPD